MVWRGGLVLPGHAGGWVLEVCAVERMLADRRVLDVSDQIHRGVVDIADAVRQRRTVPAVVADPVATALLRNARAMIDIDYAGSPLVADDWGTDADTAEPHPGQRYPDWITLGGASHHLPVFGPIADTESLARLDRRWSKCVKISHDPGVDPARAGVPTGGIVLIRPDGHIGFRSPSADAGALASVDRHLSSY